MWQRYESKRSESKWQCHDSLLKIMKDIGKQNKIRKIVTLPPSYCPRILDLVYDVAEQIKHYNGIGDSGKS